MQYTGGRLACVADLFTEYFNLVNLNCPMIMPTSIMCHAVAVQCCEKNSPINEDWI